jgi:catechol 2,3-dioxygenase-like lactoylglutathione lyase family enzyme
MPLCLNRIDHVVLNCRDVDATVDWYVRVLGMRKEVFATTPEEIGAQLRASGVHITEGPLAKTGALGPMTSYYCRDPDGNLIEIAAYPTRD